MTGLSQHRRLTRAKAFVLGIAAAVATFIAAEQIGSSLRGHKALGQRSSGNSPSSTTADANSAIYPITVRRVRAPADSGSGGAIATFGDNLLILTRVGEFHWMPTEGTGFQPLRISAPADMAPLEKYFDRDKERDALGYKDMLVRKRDGAIEITVSRTAVDENRPCVGLAISRIVVDWEVFRSAETNEAEWRELWQSAPCLDDPAGAFLLQSGGAMAYGPDADLYVFVGDFGFDDFNRSRPGIGPQYSASDYGKVIRIDPETGRSAHLSLGHRNPGGLTFTAGGELWATEHGARGGDELNLIRKGRNYGWPLETYGAHYTLYSWPMDPTPGDHDRFEKPVHAWVPSVATSALTEIRGREFSRWDGDLLVATLKAGMLRRVHVRDGRAIVDEPIPLGERIRDLALDEDGRIYAKLDGGDVLVLTRRRESPESTSTVAEALMPCRDCHRLSRAGVAGRSGPPLIGVLGREIASAEGYRYSEALGQQRGVWTKARLTRYLSNPNAFAPGTSMPQTGLDEAGVEEVVRALKVLREWP